MTKYYDALQAEVSQIQTGAPSAQRNGKPTEAELYGFGVPITLVVTILKVIANQTWTPEEKEELRVAAIKIFDEHMPTDWPVISGWAEGTVNKFIRAIFVYALGEMLK
jgi:hypothetical protein